MSHPRNDLRDAIFTSLGTVGALAKVSKSRIYNFSTIQLPAASVYTLRERSTRDTVKATLSREVDVMIDVHVKATDALDDEIDTICAAIEAALGTDPKFGGKAIDSYLAETTIGLAKEAEQPTGLAKLRYTATYRTTKTGVAA